MYPPPYDGAARPHQAYPCGYDGASVQDLVDATGVQRGSLYAAFSDKRGIYLAALDRYREQLTVPMLAALATGGEVRQLVREMLADQVEQAVRDPDRRGCLIVNAALQRLPHDPAVATKVRDTVRALEDALRDTLADAQRRGQLDEGEDPRVLARFLVIAVQGLRVMGVVDPDRTALTSAVEVALGCLD